MTEKEIAGLKAHGTYAPEPEKAYLVLSLAQLRCMVRQLTKAAHACHGVKPVKNPGSTFVVFRDVEILHDSTGARQICSFDMSDATKREYVVN